MTVRELGYKPYTGKRLGRLRRILAIAGVGVRLGFRRRFLVIALLLAVPLTFMFGVLFYWAADESVEFISHATLFFTPHEWKEILGSNYDRYDLWTVLLNRHLTYQLLWVLVVIPWVGPALLSDDFQSGALTIYFSKPITRSEYLAGKWLVLAFFVACVTAVPSTLLYVVSILMCRNLDVFVHTLYLVPAVWLLSMLVALVGGLMMMAFSASGRSRRFAALGWLMTVMGSWTLVSVVKTAPHLEKPAWIALLSFKHNIDLIGKVFFDVRYPLDVSPFLALGMLLGVGFLSLAYVWRRVNTVEGLR